MSIERKLAAIMFTDIVGFTKIMGDDESTALSILENQQSLINPIVEERKGTIIKKMGDGMLIEFPSTVEAVECATQMQNSIKAYNSSDDNLEFHIRIGIHLGDVVILGDDILGDGVNIASRIEPLASPDGICITDAVFQSVKSKLKLDAKRIDEVDLKNIDDKYIIYKIPDVNISDKEELLSDENNPKIIITDFNIISKMPNEFLKSLYLSLLFSFIFGMFFNFAIVMVNLVSGIFTNDYSLFKDFVLFPQTLYEPQFALFFTIFNEGFIGYIKFLLVSTICFSLLVRKKEEKILFADIRNVDTILDYMITESSSILTAGRYTIISKEGNSITYYPYAPTAVLRNFEKFLNSVVFKIAPVMMDFETLTLTYDGNVVVARGAWHSINKLKKKLKILELI